MQRPPETLSVQWGCSRGGPRVPRSRPRPRPPTVVGVVARAQPIFASLRHPSQRTEGSAVMSLKRSQCEKDCTGNKRVLRRHGTLVSRLAVSLNTEMKEQMDFYFLSGQVAALTLTSSTPPGYEHLVNDKGGETPFKLIDVDYSSCDVTSAEHMQVHGSRCVGELLMVMHRGGCTHPGEELHGVICDLFRQLDERDAAEQAEANTETQAYPEEESAPDGAEDDSSD
eukprot:885619-Pyramimonas_sp.AAC.1